MAVGMEGFLGVGINSATGASSVTIVDFIPFVTETLAVKRTDLEDPSIWTNWDTRRMYNGLQDLDGRIEVIPHPLLFPYLCRLAFDQCTVAPTTGASSASGVRAHIFTCLNTQFQAGSGSDLPTATIEMNRGPVMGSGSSFMYYECTGNALEVSVEAGGLVRGAVELVGREFGGKSRSAAAYVPPQAFLWSQCSLSLNGGGTTQFTSLTWRLNNNIEGVAKLDGRLRRDIRKRNDFRRIEVSGNLVFETYSEYNYFLAGSEAQMIATFTGDRAVSGTVAEQMIIDCPRFRYTEFPLQIGGPGLLSIGFRGRAMIDPTSLYPFQITFVNTRVSAYTVNTTA